MSNRKKKDVEETFYVEGLKLRVRERAIDFVDYDYLHKLSPEELAWLRKFTNALYCSPGIKYFDEVGIEEEDRKAIYRGDNRQKFDAYRKINKFRRGDDE